MNKNVKQPSNPKKVTANAKETCNPELSCRPKKSRTMKSKLEAQVASPARRAGL